MDTRPGGARRAGARPVVALSAATVVHSRAVVPVVVTGLVRTASGLLLGVGTGLAGNWSLLGLAVAPAWLAACCCSPRS